MEILFNRAYNKMMRNKCLPIMNKKDTIYIGVVEQRVRVYFSHVHDSLLRDTIIFEY